MNPLQAELFYSACRRRSERRRQKVLASFGRGFDRIMVEVTDLSLEGACLASPVPVLPGTNIWLKLPLLASREAAVVWCRGDQIGCQFAEPLHPMTFDTLTRPRAWDDLLVPDRRATIAARTDRPPPKTG